MKESTKDKAAGKRVLKAELGPTADGQRKEIRRQGAERRRKT